MSLRRLRMLLIGLLSVALLSNPAYAGREKETPGHDDVREAEQFYFVLPDRFANGDPSNDRGHYQGDRTKTGYDPADKGFYHGGDLRGVINRLDYIQGLGTTAIWLAPIFKNQPVQGDSAGYHGYWINDFTQVDPHFGTREDLKELVRIAHKRGIKIYLDVIVNHTADLISYRENQQSYVDKKTAPYLDREGQPFDDANYADGSQGFPAVGKTPYTPVVNGPKVPAWLNDPMMYHNRGDSTFSGENSTYGDFFGLDDLWTERPEVVQGMTKIYSDWVKDTGVDGFRLDTAKHVNMEFWPQFSDAIMNRHKNFFMFGEVYSADPSIMSSYVREGKLPAVLDFGFQAAATGFVNGGSGTGLAELYAADSLYTSRKTNANALPTFLGNHDMGRIGTFTGSVEKSRLAHELMMLTRGQPVIYSGDEQGFTGNGGDKDARQDMFASKTPDYLDDDLLGTDRPHAQDNYDTNHPLYRAIAELGALRKNHEALRNGTQTTRYAGDGVFAFSRLGADGTEYIVAVNSSMSAKTVPVNTFGAASWSRIYGSGAFDGSALSVGAQSTTVFRAGAKAPSSALNLTLNVPSLQHTQSVITASVTGDPNATVSVSAQVGNGKWQMLGTATTAPYRVHHDLKGLAGNTVVRYHAVARDSRGRTVTASASTTVATPPQAAQRDYVLVHYQRPDGNYADWRLYTWGDIDPTQNLPWPQGQPFAGRDAYGAFAWVKVKPGATSIGYLVIDANGNKDVATDRFIDPSQTYEVWLKQGETALQPAPAPTEPPANTAVLHYRRADGNYAGWGLHLWDGNANPVEWNSPMLPTRIDSYGATFEIPLVPGATGVSYIVHKGDEKDLPNDQRLNFSVSGREAWILSGRQAYLRPEVKTSGGSDIDLTKSFAQLLDRRTLAWKKPNPDGKVYGLAVFPNGGASIVDGKLAGTFSTVAMTAKPNGLTEAQRERFPQLWEYPTFGLEIKKSDLRGQVIATESDHTGKLLSATGVQIAGAIDDHYAPAASEKLGVIYERNQPTLKLWAPTAHKVELELGDTVVPMRLDERTGVWSASGKRDWDGKSYRYRVTTWQGTRSVTDPYSVALTPNSTHSVIARLGTAKVEKFDGRPHVQEVSVRDFSITDASVPAELRGTYGAFTVDSAGTRHLKALAEAGVTHLHLLPAFDFATIPELRSDQAVPACDLASLPANSPQQQECVDAVRARDGYNWGYDPLHYTVPEGGYAVNPAGTARNGEFKAMVDALHAKGLRVVMDVVYNHTSAPSPLDSVVPGYYHRLAADGSIETSTCCLNTAPENMMMGKLVVDSVVTWASAYGVDGFRFDLMGHHPKANMIAVREALDKLPNGKSILLYGEGWNFGEVANNARFVQATQQNMAGTGIGTFNDRLRDAVRGGGPFDDDPRQLGFASGLGAGAKQTNYEDLIKVALTGNLADYKFTGSSGSVVRGRDVLYNGSPAGYTATPSEGVTYVDAHDNEILFDALAYKLTGVSPADRARMQVLALSTVVLGQGTGFVTFGSDRLRSKSLDRNSYDSGDWFNAVEWDCAKGNGFGRGLPPAWDNAGKWQYAGPLLADPSLVPSCADIALATARYQELLRIRKSSKLFALSTLDEVQRKVSFPVTGTPGVITMVLRDDRETIVVVFNGTGAAATQSLPGLGTLKVAPSVDPVMAGASYANGVLTVPARTVAVFTSR